MDVVIVQSRIGRALNVLLWREGFLVLHFHAGGPWGKDGSMDHEDARGVVWIVLVLDFHDCERSSSEHATRKRQTTVKSRVSELR
nr:hypothetical protein CFP56_76034 [Quercus suber]